MPSDKGDPSITTVELPPLVFSGRAGVVVVLDSQRAIRWDADNDPSVIPERFAQRRGEPLSVVEVSGLRHEVGAATGRQPGRTVHVVLAFVIFAVPAMLFVALMIALAVR